MASGGSYVLLSNDKSIDKYLLSTDLLSKRIANIINKKTSDRDAQIQAKLDLIANYKKTSTSKKVSDANKKIALDNINVLNSDIDLLKKKEVSPTLNEIDHSHFFFINSSYKPMVAIGNEYSKTLNKTKTIFGGTARFDIPNFGDFFSDMVIYIKLSKMKAKNSINKVKYCDFLGHRMFNRVQFITNENIVDEYYSEDYNFYYDFELPNHKKDGWKRCIGQELPKKAYLTMDPLYQDYREVKYILDGNQTLKYQHDEVELMIPLLFWYCDPKFAVSNSYMQIEQTHINIDINNINMLAEFADYANDQSGFVAPEIIEMSLYTNHIFVNPNIRDLFNNRFKFQLIRIHKRKDIILHTSNNILLNDLKFPVESMYMAFRPVSNSTNIRSMEKWNSNNNITYTEIAFPAILHDNSLAITHGYYYKEERLITRLGLTSAGVILCDAIPALFYDSYIPTQYNKNALSTPSELGSYMINFNLFPNEYQPCGYLNTSNTRELYLELESNLITTDNPVQFILTAKALNFIILENGKMTLKYTF